MSDGTISGEAYGGSPAPEPTKGGGYGPVASGSTLASIGLSAYGAILGGKGAQAANEYKADRLQRSAEIGRIAATETGAEYSRELTNTLGMIDVVRSAAHTDPTSPTGVAVREYEQQRGSRAKTVAVGNILSQVDQQEADAKYLRYAGKQALLAGNISAGATVLKGIGQMGQGG